MLHIYWNKFSSSLAFCSLIFRMLKISLLFPLILSSRQPQFSSVVFLGRNQNLLSTVPGGVFYTLERMTWFPTHGEKYDFLSLHQFHQLWLSGSLTPGTEDPYFRKENAKAKHLASRFRILEFWFLLWVYNVFSVRSKKKRIGTLRWAWDSRRLQISPGRCGLPRRVLSFPWDLTCWAAAWTASVISQRSNGEHIVPAESPRDTGDCSLSNVKWFLQLQQQGNNEAAELSTYEK